MKNKLPADLTVGEVNRWLDKLELIKSRGAKLAMVKHLLATQREQMIKRVKLVDTYFQYGSASGGVVKEKILQAIKEEE